MNVQYRLMVDIPIPRNILCGKSLLLFNNVQFPCYFLLYFNRSTFAEYLEFSNTYPAKRITFSISSYLCEEPANRLKDICKKFKHAHYSGARKSCKTLIKKLTDKSQPTSDTKRKRKRTNIKACKINKQMHEKYIDQLALPQANAKRM